MSFQSRPKPSLSLRKSSLSLRRPSRSLLRPSRSPRVGLVQVCLAGVLWGTGGLTVQAIRAIDPLHPLTISAWRLAIAAVVLLGGALVLRSAGAVVGLLRRSPRRVVAVALGTAAYQFLYFSAVTHAGVTVATMVSLGLAPILLFLAPGAGRPQRRTPGDVAVLTTALAGLALVSLSAGHGTGGTSPMLGVIEACASGSAYAAATRAGWSLSRAAAPTVVTTATTTIGALALIPLAAAFAGPLYPHEPRAWVWLGYLGVMTMALAYTLFYAGLRTVPAGSAAIATLLEPVTAAVLAAAVFGERLRVAGTIGCILVLAAVAGLGRTNPRRGR
ncbi:MAG: DMT family transporter [Micromonosporaceae bacterium]|nr:DMT family transporter [Micromonosporaceae bacterium]